MSDEEKKATEYLKQNSIPILRYDNFGNILSPLYYGTFEKEIILNLIEKQNSIIKNAIDYIQHNNKELKNYSEQEMLDWLYGLDKCCEIKEEN